MEPRSNRLRTSAPRDARLRRLETELADVIKRLRRGLPGGAGGMRRSDTIHPSCPGGVRERNTKGRPGGLRLESPRDRPYGSGCGGRSGVAGRARTRPSGRGLRQAPVRISAIVINRVPVVHTYRTLCLAPPPEMRSLFEQLEGLLRAC